MPFLFPVTVLVVFGSLVLVVAVVESFVFRRVLSVSSQDVFGRIIWANTLSMIASSVVLYFQDDVVRACKIDESLLSFASGYWWVAILLIAIYFAKSLLVWNRLGELLEIWGTRWNQSGS